MALDECRWKSCVGTAGGEGAAGGTADTLFRESCGSRANCGECKFPLIASVYDTSQEWGAEFCIYVEDPRHRIQISVKWG